LQELNTLPYRIDHPPLLDVQGLTVEYCGREGSKCVAVADVTFEVAAGEIVGIFGESGCGKTTLGLSLLNLLPRSARRTASSLSFLGLDLLKISESEMRRVRGNEISIMYQEPALALNPVLRVGDQIADVIRAHNKMTAKERHERVWELLRNVNLDQRPGIYEAYPHELSGGERHRIVIAQALACHPALVIADEPTAGLDPELKLEIAELIDQLRKELNVSFLLISHDRRLLARIADRMLEMSAGHVQEHTIKQPSVLRELDVAHPAEPLRSGSLWREPLVAVRGLTKSYNKRGIRFRSHCSVEVLRGVDLTIGRGSALALVGRSGSGKSTLARCLTFWERPDAGAFFLGGRSVVTASQKETREIAPRLQLVLQDSASAFNPNFTAEQIVEEPLLIQGVAPKERKVRVRRMIEEVDLPSEVLSRQALALSGGQRQRLAIARALILQPNLIVFDESTTGLDRETLQQIIDLLIKIKASHNLTYLLISHDLEVINAIADHVAIMHQGRIISTAPIAEGLHHLNMFLSDLPRPDIEDPVTIVEVR
jgi:peptide/nickel transport system ATP-binding protein